MPQPREKTDLKRKKSDGKAEEPATKVKKETLTQAENDEWTSPPAPAELPDRVPRGYFAKPEREWRQSVRIMAGSGLVGLVPLQGARVPYYANAERSRGLPNRMLPPPCNS